MSHERQGQPFLLYFPVTLMSITGVNEESPKHLEGNSLVFSYFSIELTKIYHNIVTMTAQLSVPLLNKTPTESIKLICIVGDKQDSDVTVGLRPMAFLWEWNVCMKAKVELKGMPVIRGVRE